jgi:hypothetical protein
MEGRFGGMKFLLRLPSTVVGTTMDAALVCSGADKLGEGVLKKTYLTCLMLHNQLFTSYKMYVYCTRMVRL